VRERPVFYYDLASPYAWLAAERVNALFEEPPVWQPIWLYPIFKAIGKTSWAFTERREPGMREIERRAAERGLLPVRWPDPLPTNSLAALRAATFAKGSGRAVAFSLAAFRQAFNAGRDLADVDNVLVAAAACELHPRAVLKGIETQSVKDELRRATDAALERGVTGVPAVAVGSELYWGDDRLEEAAAAAR
jgi:2-hydroxychromene-2-carboxylate isomerase